MENIKFYAVSCIGQPFLGFPLKNNVTEILIAFWKLVEMS